MFKAKADISHDVFKQIDEAARLIKSGKVCVIPTETAYGLAASIECEDALKRIYLIKKRPFNKPLLLLISDLEQAPVNMRKIPPYVYTLIDKFWPGPLTLLLPAYEGVSPFLTGDTGKVGVRMSSHDITHELVKRVGRPITGTSANLSGRGLTKTVEEVKAQLKDPSPDFYLDAGEIPPGPPSTILDCTEQGPLIIRQGAISQEDILDAC